jgi:hypothetical protein
MEDSIKPLNQPSDNEFEPRWREVRYEYTPQLVDILSHLNASLLVTTRRTSLCPGGHRAHRRQCELRAK